MRRFVAVGARPPQSLHRFRGDVRWFSRRFSQTIAVVFAVTAAVDDDDDDDERRRDRGAVETQKARLGRGRDGRRAHVVRGLRVRFRSVGDLQRPRAAAGGPRRSRGALARDPADAGRRGPRRRVHVPHAGVRRDRRDRRRRLRADRPRPVHDRGHAAHVVPEASGRRADRGRAGRRVAGTVPGRVVRAARGRRRPRESGRRRRRLRHGLGHARVLLDVRVQHGVLPGHEPVQLFGGKTIHFRVPLARLYISFRVFRLGHTKRTRDARRDGRGPETKHQGIHQACTVLCGRLSVEIFVQALTNYIFPCL